MPERSNHMSTSNRLQSGHISPKNRTTKPDLQQKSKHEATDESIDEPFSISGGGFTDLGGSINLIT